MRVLHIIPSLRKGGAERMAVTICNELHARGYEVRILVFSKENAYNSFSKCPVDIVAARIDLSIFGKTNAVVTDLVSYVKTFAPEVIHTHLFIAELVARWHLFPRTRYITHCHDNMPQLRAFAFPDLLSKKRLTELYERNFICKKYSECNNRFVSISKHTQDYYLQNLPKPFAKDITLLPNAIDMSLFYNKNTRPHDQLVIVNSGNFLPKKNSQLLVRIAFVLKKKAIPFRIIMLGDGDQKNATKSLADKLNVADCFCFAGYVDNVNECYNSATIYVHTALYEPFGLVLIEAMSTGLPVVALDGGGNADIIEDGENGYLIEAQDPELFSDRILSIWEDKERYQRMSRNAQEHAKKYDIKTYADRLIQVYQD